jgi:hypothetical protein
MNRSPRYRIEHRRPDRAASIVAVADAVARGMAQLRTEASWLHRAGEAGTVVLVRQDGDRDIAVRVIGAGP